MKAMKKACRKVFSAILAAAVLVSGMPQIPASEVQAASGEITSVVSATAEKNLVTVEFNDGVQAKITFLEDDIFRYNVDPSGEFSEYATTQYGNTTKIPQYPDSSEEYSHPDASVSEADGFVVITSGNTTIKFEKATAKMSVAYNDRVVLEESEALALGSKTTQSLVKHDGENYFGGGTQNGRFIHTGKSINIANESNWVDGGVASPNPFYYTSAGYGVLRNTFKEGVYHFGSTVDGEVKAVHNENEFDAYYFLSDGADVTAVVQDILDGYWHVTGNPVLLPEYAFYEGHLNAYNRDSWSETSGSKKWEILGSNASDGSEGALSAHIESGMSTGYVLSDGMAAESLNGTKATVAIDNYPDVTTPYEYSARAVIDQYVEMDMPLGYFLPNDGYGAGYGQNGYYMTGGVNADGSSSAERLAAVDANVENLAEFTEYARSKGVETGLWTQSYLTPDSNSNTYWHLLRDFNKEVNVGGVTTLKTDVAWVGYGYDMALNATKTGYDIVTTGVNYRPNIISLDGWAGTQRFAGIWSGDQYGGNWEYIRFHIPTYIGQSLSGNPNIGSDMDGIFGGDKLITTRDTQWKVFTPTMLNMDGWGSYAKTPQTFGDPYTGINRMYLKLKAQLLPYIYTSAASAANIDTGNDDTGLPMIRAMFLEYPDDAYAATRNMQYQYMFGENVLVAPVFEETENIDTMGNDVRNGIYLPDEDQIWIDYFTGDQYRGGQTLNNFDAPLWKLPVFVKNGAIIPMWEENNNPAEIDKANRQVEFWPAGSTEYTLFEDEGTYVENNQTEVEGYGMVNDISYGDHVSAKYTSVVENGTATLTAEKSTGSYEGYDQNKNTSFIVNVSREPSKVTAKNGSTALTMVKADSKEAVLNAEVKAGTFVYYYDEAPAVETYAADGEDEFAEMMKDQVSSPKLYVKFAETDSQANAQVLTLEGFENVDEDLPVEKLDTSLSAPANLRDVDAEKTPTSNSIAWDAVEGAESYEIRVDGVINNVGTATTFLHRDQEYNSTHTYQVRVRNAEGYSSWSEEIEATTLLDPWRNVPSATITWNGGDSWGALEYATDHDTKTMFHSTGEVTSSDFFWFDYGDAYELDKFEYYPRDNYGNGTVKSMTIWLSMDGANWQTVQSPVWSYNSALPVEQNVKTIDLSGYAARYVVLSVNDSVGGFFSANELAVYKKAGSSQFAVGSTSLLTGVADGDYTNMKNYLGTSEKDGSSFVDQIQKRFGDINYNGVYDVYDYAYTMFKLDGGTTKSGTVSGNVQYTPSAASVKAGETFTVEVAALDAKNVNAFGQVINYDPAKVEFVSVEADASIAGMEDLSVNKVYEDGTAYVNLAYANRGDKDLYSGTGTLAAITMKAKEDVVVTAAMELTGLNFIGPDYAVVAAEATSGPVMPELSEGTTTEYSRDDIAEITITNEVLTEDDGTNVSAIIQQESFEGLFDGTIGRDFEFLWDIENNYVDGALPAHVTLPVTLTLTLDEAKPVNIVSVFNANKGNGYMTAAEAVLKYSDGTESEKAVVVIGAEEEQSEFKFTWENGGKEVTAVEITVNSAVNSANEAVMNMLTLAEIKLAYNDYVPLTMICSEGNETSIEVGETAQVIARFAPVNATNMYFKAESQNPEIAEISVVQGAYGYAEYYVTGVSEGRAIITLTALENESLIAEYELVVTEGGETELPDTPTKPEIEGTFTADALYSESNYANNMFDGDLLTYWESPYWTDDAFLPKDVVVDLGKTYTLEAIEFISHTIPNGGITAYELYVSMDGEEWTRVAEGTKDADAYRQQVNVTITEVFEEVNAKYVKLTALGAVGRIEEEDNQYARIAEMNFYGEAVKCAVHEETELKDKKDATCTADGYTGDVVCKECQTVLEEGEVIPAAGHSWGEWTVVKEPTTDAKGKEERSCSVCQEKETRDIDKLPKPENPFEDISEGDYFYDAVLWAVENEVTSGMTETLFVPYNNCTRAEIVVFLYRAMKGTESDVECKFLDVDPEDFYYEAMLWAVEEGITTGITETEFQPWKECTRAEIVTFLWRAMGSEEVTTDKVFPDVNEADFFYDAVAWAVENGVTQGRNDGTFGAWLGCWRCDAVTFIQRAVGK